MGYVYKITNTVNGKAYIGISVHEPEKVRIKDHLSGRGNRIIASAVKKYGKDAFTYEVLEANVFDEFLPDLEVTYIAHYNTIAPHGYNLNSGGSHAIPSELTRQKLSKINKGENHHSFGKPLSVEHRQKISDSLKGHKVTTEVRLKISSAQKGKKRKPLTAEHRQKISDGNKGKTMSTSARRKISESRRGEKNPMFGKKGENHHSFGRKHSADARRKMSEAAKKRTRCPEYRRKISERQQHSDYLPARSLFFSLPSDMLMSEKTRRLSQSFSVDPKTIRNWIQKWNEGAPKPYDYLKRHPDYIRARTFFLSLDTNIPLREKRKLLYQKFPRVSGRSIRTWVRDWIK